MIIPDVNLLLYAVVDAFPQHAKAQQWWEDTLNSNELVGLSDPAIFGFLRITTNPRIITPALTADQAARQIESWLELPNVRWAQPGPGHHARAFGYLRAAGTAGNLTTDAQLAAIAAGSSNAIVCSNDSDFARFSDIIWRNPLTE